MSTTPSFILSREDEELRQKNYELIVKFMSQGGPNRDIGRKPLLAEDGKAVMAFTQSGVPHESLMSDWIEATVRDFPNWEYPEFEIFMTQYPDKFWGNVISRGAFGDSEIKDGRMYTYYECKDGKISLYMEMYNPIAEAPSVGKEQIERGEI